jgi:aminoglycoside phosphotransferase (APT) family kinase protein
MHTGQVDVTAGVAARLVARQFPQWRDLPVRAVISHGTVNALFRLGDGLVLRFPLRPSLDPKLRDDLIREQENARRIAAHSPVRVPEPVALGAPGPGYQGPWAVYRWIPGDTATPEGAGSSVTFARELAGFVTALRGMDTGGRGWDGQGRGGPLRDKDRYVRAALAESGHLTDTTRIGELWDRCLALPPYEGPDVWIHTDLMPGNLLVRGGRLAAVIDVETAGVGDPAVDLMPAWNLLAGPAREAYRSALGADGVTWERGRGWAILQAIVALPYYVTTNPVMAGTARHTLRSITLCDRP